MATCFGQWAHQLGLQNETLQTDPWNEPWCGSWPPNAPVHWYACWLGTAPLQKQKKTKNPPHTHTQTHQIPALKQMFPESRSIHGDLKSSTHPGAQPAGGCRCPPSKGSQCRRQRWAAARTAGQSVASRRFPPGSGKRRKRKGAPAGSRRTGPS